MSKHRMVFFPNSSMFSFQDNTNLRQANAELTNQNQVGGKLLLQVLSVKGKGCMSQRPNGQSLSRFPQPEACLRVLLVSPGHVAGPSQGYPIPQYVACTHLYTWVTPDLGVLKPLCHTCLHSGQWAVVYIVLHVFTALRIIYVLFQISICKV